MFVATLKVQVQRTQLIDACKSQCDIKAYFAAGRLGRLGDPADSHEGVRPNRDSLVCLPVYVPAPITPGTQARAIASASWHIVCCRERPRYGEFLVHDNSKPDTLQDPLPRGRTVVRRFRSPEPRKSIPTRPNFDGARITLNHFISQTIADVRSAYHMDLLSHLCSSPWRCTPYSERVRARKSGSASRAVGPWSDYHAIMATLSRHRE